MRARSKHGPERRANAPSAEATSRPGLDQLGRVGAREQGFFPTDLGCPDCRGVLYVTELGHHGFLAFRCRVGHAFSTDALLELKEDRLDEALWIALELLDELVQIYTTLDARHPRSGRARPNERVSRAVRHRRILRALIRNEGPAAG